MHIRHASGSCGKHESSDEGLGPVPYQGSSRLILLWWLLIIEIMNGNEGGFWTTIFGSLCN